MSASKLALLLAALAVTGCVPDGDALGVIKVRHSGQVWPESVVSHAIAVEMSECVAEQVGALSDEEIESWRASLCDADAHGGGMSCSGLTVSIHEGNAAELTFTFEGPRGYAPDSYFAIGPFPTVELSMCDPVVYLLGEGPQYEGSGGSAERPSPADWMRADGLVYPL